MPRPVCHPELVEGSLPCLRRDAGNSAYRQPRALFVLPALSILTIIPGMAKASFTLPDGTTVTIDGTPQEVHELLAFYAKGKAKTHSGSATTTAKARSVPAPAERVATDADESSVNLADVVNLLKNCEEAEVIEKQILDKPSQVNRTLLPMYIVHEHMENRFGLTSGEISKITAQLGAPISTANASATLAGAATRYVVGDRVRKTGESVRYKLSRRGVQYVKSILHGAPAAGENT